MFTFKRLLAAATAAAMLSTTTAAVAANPAAPLPVAAHTRAGTPLAHDSKLGSDVSTTTLISIGILAALIVIVLVAVDDNKDSPNSP